MSNAKKALFPALFIFVILAGAVLVWKMTHKVVPEPIFPSEQQEGSAPAGGMASPNANIKLPIERDLGSTSLPNSAAGQAAGQSSGSASAASAASAESDQTGPKELDLNTGRIGGEEPVQVQVASIVPKQETEDTANLPEREFRGDVQAETDPSGYDKSKADDDPVVLWSFVNGLARNLVHAYYPAGTHPDAQTSGVLTTGIQRLNMDYGVSFTGLRATGKTLPQARNAVYDYVLRPPLLKLLFFLYSDRFVAALNYHATQDVREFVNKGKTVNRRLSKKEVTECLGLIASQVRTLAAILKGLSHMPDLVAQIDQILMVELATRRGNKDFVRALNVYLDLKAVEQPDAPSAQASAALLQAESAMNALGARYQQAIRDREAARTHLVDQLQTHAGVKELPPGTSLFVAKWYYRRLIHSATNEKSLPTVVTHLNELAGKIK